MKRRIKLELSYDGTRYSGWQAQADVPTIQRTVESRLERIIGHHANLLGSGRTDAGVHAIQQVAAFWTENTISAQAIAKALNATLPNDIRIINATDVPFEFHPINDVKSKRYRYVIDDSHPPFPFFLNHSWIVYKPLDLALMQEAATHLIGHHDFAAFQSVGSPRTSTFRTIYDISVRRSALISPWSTVPYYSELRSSEAPQVKLPIRIDESHNSANQIDSEHSFIIIEVEADGFLYNMVRAIAGSLFLLGSSASSRKGSRGHGKSASFMKEMLVSRDRIIAGPTAPAHGLYMLEVVY
ncbi:MAG: tRNA pseudouridine(38-40) synthase TruA [Thermoguttaceae bacterium]